jgi:hypothetical protein
MLLSTLIRALNMVAAVGVHGNYEFIFSQHGVIILRLPGLLLARIYVICIQHWVFGIPLFISLGWITVDLVGK